MKKILSVLVLSLSLTACNSAKEENVAVKTETESAPKLAVKKEAQELSAQEKAVYEALATFARSHIKKSNNNIIPNKRAPKVEKKNNMYVASYVEFDPDSLSMELIPTTHRQYKYLAKIKYRERLFQSKAETKKLALNGDFSVVGSRFITEVPRYKQGKWCY